MNTNKYFRELYFPLYRWACLWPAKFYLLITFFLLTGCYATVGGTLDDSEILVGPEGSYASEIKNPVRAIQRELEVIIPVFDPNIPEDTEEWEEEGIWPELRRVESVNFALEMKKALEETNQLGAIRVTPDQKVTGDIYVIGKINESNGEDVSINIKVISIDGKSWLSKNYKHRVAGYSFANIRNKDKSAYYPVFEEAATDIAELLKSKKSDYLETINQLAEIRFGHSMSDKGFAQFLEFTGNQVKLVRAPSNNDPMLNRLHQYRVEDQFFTDQMQQNYYNFAQKVAPSYSAWQEAAYFEHKAKRQSRKKAMLQALAGLIIGVAAIASDSESSAGKAVKTGAVIASGVLLASSAQSYQEAKFHQDALMELGRSADLEVAPQVIEFEEKTIKLTGDMMEQFNQWRAALKRIYIEERTPDRQL